MRHRYSGRKLNRTSSHRKALMSNLCVSIVIHEQIRTTVAKAKELRSFAEKMVTIGKKPTLANRRRLISILGDESAVSKILDVLAVRYAARNGGYTRVIKAGRRYGDMAEMAIIEFVDRDLDAKGKDDKVRVAKERQQQLDDQDV